LIHPFEQIFEAIESVSPESDHVTCPIYEWSERCALRAVMGLASRRTATHKASLFKHPEMFGNSRLRDARAIRQCPNRRLSFTAQPFEKGSAGRIGECSKENILRFGHDYS